MKKKDRAGHTFSLGLLYAGYIMMIREAKPQCDHFITSIQKDSTIERSKGKTNLCRL